eukprot:1966946-Rhodomonas_salina.1
MEREETTRERSCWKSRERNDTRERKRRVEEEEESKGGGREQRAREGEKKRMEEEEEREREGGKKQTGIEGVLLGSEGGDGKHRQPPVVQLLEFQRALLLLVGSGQELERIEPQSPCPPSL